MRKLLALVLVLSSGAALAQDKPPPTVGDKPLVQVKPKTAAAPKAAAAPKEKPQSIPVRMQACLEIDDETKERLNCFDAIFPPKPKARVPAPKSVTDCTFFKEEDARLKCFNGFAEKLPTQATEVAENGASVAAARQHRLEDLTGQEQRGRDHRPGGVFVATRVSAGVAAILTSTSLTGCSVQARVT